jgi:PAS domain S-box-containing protein
MAYVVKDIEKLMKSEPVQVVYNVYHRPPVPEDSMLTTLFRRSNCSWMLDLLNDSEFRQEIFFDKFVTLMQNVKVCVTLADADVKRRGFPVLWVNTEFESVTGYSGAEMYGNNFAILQKQNSSFAEPMRSESDSLKLISSALRQGVPTRVRVTNFRKDGTPLVNLMAIKPIFFGDTAKYMVGMQFDVSAKGSIGKFALLNELMSSIPDVVSPGF